MLVDRWFSVCVPVIEAGNWYFRVLGNLNQCDYQSNESIARNTESSETNRVRFFVSQKMQNETVRMRLDSHGIETLQRDSGYIKVFPVREV